MIKDINKIIWPEARYWAASWNEYLYLGFLNLGLNVERTAWNIMRNSSLL